MVKKMLEKGPASWIRPPWGKHTPWRPLHDRLSHYWIGEAAHNDPPGAFGRSFMCDLSRSWKIAGMSWATNKVSSIDRGLNMATCLAPRLMGNNRLALLGFSAIHGFCRWLLFFILLSCAVRRPKHLTLGMGIHVMY